MPTSIARPQDRPDAHDIAAAVEALVRVVHRHPYPDMMGPWAVAMLGSKLGVQVTIGDQDDGVKCLDLLGPVGNDPQFDLAVNAKGIGLSVGVAGVVDDPVRLVAGVGTAWADVIMELAERVPDRRAEVFLAAHDVVRQLGERVRGLPTVSTPAPPFVRRSGS